MRALVDWRGETGRRSRTRRRLLPAGGRRGGGRGRDRRRPGRCGQRGRRAGLRRPAGERLRRGRLPGCEQRRLPRRRRCPARDGRDRIPADADHEPGGGAAQCVARGPARRGPAADPRRPSRRAVPLPRPPRRARRIVAPGPGPRPARPAARCRRGAADDARAGAAGSRRADRPARRARRDGVARAHRCDRGAGERRVRPRRARCHTSLQRDAAVHAPRSRRDRREPCTHRRRRLGDRRRHPPRAGDGPARLARGRRPARTRHRRDHGRRRLRRRVQLRRARHRGDRRRRPRPGRCARRERPDDDRGGPEPARPRRAARAGGRGRDLHARPLPR